MEGNGCFYPFSVRTRLLLTRFFLNSRSPGDIISAREAAPRGRLAKVPARLIGTAGIGPARHAGNGGSNGEGTGPATERTGGDAPLVRVQ